MSGDVYVLGAGMHPWGKWGRNFVEYGVHAARAALADAGIGWRDVELIVGAETVRSGYPGYVAGATFAQALGWTGARVATTYAACASGTAAIALARANIVAGMVDVALVVGADTTPKGFLAPVVGERPDDPDWLRFRLLGASNPTYFGLYARRRMAMFGATAHDFARVRAKNGRHGLTNPNARYRKAFTEQDVLDSAVVADPLHLLDICATSDGGAAVVLVSEAVARRMGVVDGVRIRAVSTVTPSFPETLIEMPNFATDSAAGVADVPDAQFRDSIARAAFEEAGIEPDDLSLAEVYDLSSALELDWYENLGLCARGEAETLLRSGATELGGRLPVNPSGGLACFGEAVPAQAIAQVCEVTWQLRGQAGERQVAGSERRNDGESGSVRTWISNDPRALTVDALDVSACKHLVSAYASAADQRNAEAVAALFRVDGVLTTRTHSVLSEDAVFTGRAEIARAVGRLRPLVSCSHVVTTCLVAEESGMATGTTHGTVQHVYEVASGRRVEDLVVRYDDVFAVEDREWRFGNRVLNILEREDVEAD